MNCSFGSYKKSDVSSLLLILSFALKKRVICSKKLIVFSKLFTVFTSFHLFMPKSESLFLKERQERFALVALYKRVAVSDSLPSQFKREQNRVWLFWANHYLALSLTILPTLLWPSASAAHLIVSVQMNSCLPKQLFPGTLLSMKRTAVTQTAYYPVTLVLVFNYLSNSSQ